MNNIAIAVYAMLVVTWLALITFFSEIVGLSDCFLFVSLNRTAEERQNSYELCTQFL